MGKLFILLFILFSIGFIYFLFMVSIQFTRINKINLQLGMDVTKLYDNDEEPIYCLNYAIKKCAMFMYKISAKV